uniref:Uncharacterized protein n=1 Tax=Ixodes scapularis TaxID=6945 RepID=A0A4D5RC44_IXOSC
MMMMFSTIFAFQSRLGKDIGCCGVNVNEVPILWEPCEGLQVWSCLILISSVPVCLRGEWAQKLCIFSSVTLILS